MLNNLWRTGIHLLIVSSILTLIIAPIDGMAKEKGLKKKDSSSFVLPEKGVNSWVPTGDFDTSSLIKVPRYLDKLTGDVTNRKLTLSAVRNEQVSAQLAVDSTKDVKNLKATVSDLEDENGHKIDAENVQTRFVGYVPVKEKSDKIGGSFVKDVAGRAVSSKDDKTVVADPLLEDTTMDVPSHEAQPMWFTFNIPKSAKASDYDGAITIQSDNEDDITYNLTLSVDDVEIPDAKDYAFDLDNWLNPNAIAKAYDVEPWTSEEHWDLIKKYMKNLAESGQSTITTTIIKNPWVVSWNDSKPQTATGYDSMIDWGYDGEKWTFDYSKFDRYVKTGLEAGLGPNINAYSMLTFDGPQRITYFDKKTDKEITKKTEAGSEFWTEAWTAFLNDFSDHLKRKGWMDQTYLSFDERPAEMMSKALDLIEKNAPEFLAKTQVAGTDDVDPYAQSLSLGWDSLNRVSDDWIQRRKDEGKKTTYYAWAGDNHPNSLSYSPAVESRMMPWVSANRGLDGLLHWAYNNWTEDVFQDPLYVFSQGDEYFVYPGENGPMSSIRWELIKEGVEDYELFDKAKKENNDNKILPEATKLATQNQDGRKKNVADVVLARDIVLSQLTTKNVNSMETMVDKFKKADNLIDKQTAHKVNMQLTAIRHFEEKHANKKAVKHLKNLKELLNHQQDAGKLSQLAYDTLKGQTNHLIDKLQ